MRGNLLGEHVEVRLNLTFGRSQNILFIMSLLFVSSPIRFTIGILNELIHLVPGHGSETNVVLCAFPMTTKGGVATFMLGVAADPSPKPTV